MSLGTSLRAETCAMMDQLSQLIAADLEPVVLLRALPVRFDWTRYDVDLLMTPARRETLLQSALEAATDGLLHFTVQQSNPHKTRLTLWNFTGDQWLHVDLWTAFTQLPRHGGRRRVVPADVLLNDAQRMLTHVALPRLGRSLALPEGAQRLRPEVECALFILHLAAKGKRLSSVVVRERLSGCIERLRSISESSDEATRLLRSAERLQLCTTMPPDVIASAERFITGLIERSGSSARVVASDKGYETESLATRIAIKLRRTWHARVATVAIVGSDGSGKSTLCEQLQFQNRAGSGDRCTTSTTSERAGSGDPRTTMGSGDRCTTSSRGHDRFVAVTGKKLYRRSWAYQLIGRAVMRIKGWTRRELDDRCPRLFALRSGVALWSKQCWMILRNLLRATRGRDELRLLLDRSPGSFLIVDRLSESPHRVSSRVEALLPPVTTVLLALPFAKLSQRRQEFTSSTGHDSYQRILFAQALGQRPADVVVVSASAPRQEVALVVEQLLCVSSIKCGALNKEAA